MTVEAIGEAMDLCQAVAKILTLVPEQFGGYCIPAGGGHFGYFAVPKNRRTFAQLPPTAPNFGRLFLFCLQVILLPLRPLGSKSHPFFFHWKTFHDVNLTACI